MNVVILGATGTFGTALTEKLLLDTDCSMTLFSRHAGDVEYNSSRVCTVSGDALNLEDLEISRDKGKERVRAATVETVLKKKGRDVLKSHENATFLA